jgi:hypothetical protein
VSQSSEVHKLHRLHKLKLVQTIQPVWRAMLGCSSAVRAMPMAVVRVGSGSTRGRRGCGHVARAETSEMLPAPWDTMRPKEQRTTPLSISPQVERASPAPSRPLPQFDGDLQESGRTQPDATLTVPAEGFTSSRVSPLPTTFLPYCPSPSSSLALAARGKPPSPVDSHVSPSLGGGVVSTRAPPPRCLHNHP